MFWLPAAALLVLGAAFVVLPLLRKPPRGGGGHAAAVRLLYRQRLAELDDETRRELLEEGEREEMEAELGQVLLAEWPSAGEPPERERLAAAEQGQAAPSVRERCAERPAAAAGAPLRAGGWAGLVVGLVVPLAAVGLYWHLGEPNAAVLAQAPKVVELDPVKDRIELDHWRTLLGERVVARPDEAGSWLLLGQVHMADADYAAAEAAFARAHGLAGEDAGLDLLWLQARYLAAGGRLDAVGLRLAEGVLARAPNQATALEILALDAYRRGDFPRAAAMFNRALANPLESLRRKVLQAAFEQARTQFGEGKPAIDVSVQAAQPPPEAAVLFLIARPPGGGMPYAAVRRPAAVLPRTIRLDDAVSMNPARPLSAAEAVEVVARISLAGTAAAHPGDWEWRSPPLAWAEAAAPIALRAELSPPKP